MEAPKPISLEDLRAIAIRCVEYDTAGIEAASTFEELVEEIWSAGEKTGASLATCDY